MADTLLKMCILDKNCKETDRYVIITGDLRPILEKSKDECSDLLMQHAFKVLLAYEWSDE